MWKSTTLRLLATFVALASIVAPAAAQNFPTRPMRLVHAQGPGGTSDIYARLLSTKLAEALGQPMIIDYKPGANGIVGVEAAIKSPPDGYTFLMGNSVNLAVNAAMYKKLPYDPVTDLAPVALLGKTYFTILVPSASPAGNVKEFIALAKSRPGQLNYGAGSGGARLALELFSAAAGIKLNHIPYKSTAQALTDLMGGRLDILVEATGTAIPQIKAGTVKLLGMTSPTRLSFYPDYPTIAEAGIPGFEYSAWASINAPAGIPPAIQRRVSAEIQKILATPEVITQFRSIGFEPQYGTPEQLADLLRHDVEAYRKVVRDAAIPQE